MGGPGMNFMQRPPRGWLHDDEVIRTTGVDYIVRYIGCLEILASMKLLDYDTRFLVANVMLLHHVTCLKSSFQAFSILQGAEALYGNEVAVHNHPNDAPYGNEVAVHNHPKDLYLLECINKVCESAGLRPADRWRKVEKRVARALGLRVKSDHAGFNVTMNISAKAIYLKTVEGNRQIANHEMPKISFASGGDSETLDFVAYVAKDDQDYRACYVLECARGMAQEVITTVGQAFNLRFKDYLKSPEVNPVPSSSCLESDREYYNDLPGKVPPDVATPREAIPPPVPPLPKTACMNTNRTAPRERLPSTNLIDLNSEIPPPIHAHNYVNDLIFNPRPAPRDVFDMQPFASTLPSDAVQLQEEEWFHSVIDRARAESLLKHDGDFLVRESSTTIGQYILTGLQGGTKKHLLLIDPEGMVRTKDRMFENVSDLINYHCKNQLPIISAESALVLRNPIRRSEAGH